MKIENIENIVEQLFSMGELNHSSARRYIPIAAAMTNEMANSSGCPVAENESISSSQTDLGPRTAHNEWMNSHSVRHTRLNIE